MIAAFLGKLNDSHTFFIPPPRPYSYDYGYRMQMIGGKCFVTQIRPVTDAEGKVRPEDQVLHREGYSVNRTDLPSPLYYLDDLAPQAVSNLDLVMPTGERKQVQVAAKYRKQQEVRELFDASTWAERNSLEHLMRSRQVAVGNVTMWKMPVFEASDATVDHLFKEISKRKGLVLDLRGNPGGTAGTLERMLGYIFDHNIKVADRIARMQTKPIIAKSRGDHAFSGELVVLADSNSASAAELLARVVQLERRGVVLGDRTSGMVMEAGFHPYSQGLADAVAYAFSLTEADLIMKDGKSLEHEGVVPDEVIHPTAEDLAAGRDPVLARAAELLHEKLDSTDAGKLFPFEWAPL